MTSVTTPSAFAAAGQAPEVFSAASGWGIPPARAVDHSMSRRPWTRGWNRGASQYVRPKIDPRQMEREMRGRSAVVAGSLVLMAAGCTGSADADRGVVAPERTQASPSPSSTTGPATKADPPKVRWLDHMPSGVRPDCSDGQVNRIIPGHSGWRTLKAAAAGLLRHPGADHAAVSPVRRGRATVVLYRRDDTTRATARLRLLHNLWYPNSIALCSATIA